MKWSKTRWNTCTILFLHAFLNNSLLCGVGQPKVWRTKEDQSNVWRQKSFFFLFLSRLLEISLRFKFFIQEENVPCQRGKAQLVKLLLTSQLSAKKYFKTSNQKLKLFFIFLFSNVCKNVVSIVNSVETTFFVWLIWLRSAKTGVMKTSVMMDVDRRLSTINVNREKLSGVDVDCWRSMLI